MLIVLILAALIIAILAVIFALQNANIIIVSFLIWKFQGSLALILLLTFASGFIAGLLVVLQKLIRGSFAPFGQKKKPEEPQKTPEEKEELKGGAGQY